MKLNHFFFFWDKHYLLNLTTEIFISLNHFTCSALAQDAWSTCGSWWGYSSHHSVGKMMVSTLLVLTRSTVGKYQSKSSQIINPSLPKLKVMFHLVSQIKYLIYFIEWLFNSWSNLIQTYQNQCQQRYFVLFYQYWTRKIPS